MTAGTPAPAGTPGQSDGSDATTRLTSMSSVESSFPKSTAPPRIPLPIPLDKQPTARWVALLAATAIVLYLCWLMLLPFIDVLLWSVVLAMVAWPVQSRLRKRGYSANASAMLTTALVVLTVLISLTLVTTAVVKQGATAADALHGGLRHLLDPDSRSFKWIDQYLDHVLRPRLVGKRAKLHELIIFFSVMGGLQVFGVLGLFVGPVVAAIALALVEVWAAERSEKESLSDPAPPQIPVEASLPAPDRIGGSD